jgi:hypothetical protein
MGRPLSLLCAALMGLALASASGASPAAAGTAKGSAFFGVVPQAPLTEAELTRMEGTVGTLRMPIYWFQVEARHGEYDFAALDAEIGAAADHGISVQPFVYGTPPWLDQVPTRPPLSRRGLSAWAKFLRVLVKRYGSGGEFWRGRARRQPIRIWQIWNEPNFVVFWRPKPNPAGYARLLRTSARAIREVDGRARIALAGVAPVNSGMKTWVFLRRLFRQPGVRGAFDLAALHPYSTNLLELDYQLRQVRRAMADARLGSRPLLVSEVGVASWGTAPSVFVKGPGGQAAFLEMAFRRLLDMRRRWRIAGVDWYAWRDLLAADPHCGFCQGAGLLDLEGKPKPAWLAYRRAVEGARVR